MGRAWGRSGFGHAPLLSGGARHESGERANPIQKGCFGALAVVQVAAATTHLNQQPRGLAGRHRCHQPEGPEVAPRWGKLILGAVRGLQQDGLQASAPACKSPAGSADLGRRFLLNKTTVKRGEMHDGSRVCAVASHRFLCSSAQLYAVSQKHVGCTNGQRAQEAAEARCQKTSS